jgi:hypothetical protein
MKNEIKNESNHKKSSIAIIHPNIYYIIFFSLIKYYKNMIKKQSIINVITVQLNYATWLLQRIDSN